MSYYDKWRPFTLTVGARAVGVLCYPLPRVFPFCACSTLVKGSNDSGYENTYLVPMLFGQRVSSRRDSGYWMSFSQKTCGSSYIVTHATNQLLLNSIIPDYLWTLTCWAKIPWTLVTRWVFNTTTTFYSSISHFNMWHYLSNLLLL